jgi:hypothetical protein
LGRLLYWYTFPIQISLKGATSSVLSCNTYVSVDYSICKSKSIISPLKGYGVGIYYTDTFVVKSVDYL